MHAFGYILVMLVAVLASSFLSVRFPRVSTPLVQIATGIVLTLLPISFEMHLEPDLFMVLFIAPLLFNDAAKMNKQALWRLKFPVLLLALGLVFCTVLILGFAINLFAPSIPLAAAFALAAALAPTDAVSVSSLKQNASISTEQSKLLQGESLLNDASSIVSFNFAIAAVITGTFSLWKAGGAFLVTFLGGLALGAVIMLVRYALIRFLRSRGMESISFHVLFEIITPFLIYLLAEFIGVSGIIAVVTAGIAHSFEPRVTTPSSARLNVVSSSVWSVIGFTLNGLVFLFLGTQLPYVVARVWTGTAADTNFLVIFIVLILVVILALRFVWTGIMRRNVNLRQTNREEFAPKKEASASRASGDDDNEADNEAALLSQDPERTSFAQRRAAFEARMTFERLEHEKAHNELRQVRRESRLASKQAAHADKHYWKLHLLDALVLSLSGVKGAITLAVILSVPLTLGDAEPFPERDLLIFLASGVILLSLLVANLIVPLVAPKKKQTLQEASELTAILDIYRKVIAELSATAETQERAAVSNVVHQYYRRIEALKVSNSARLPNESKVRRYLIELQLENTQHLTDNNQVSSLTAYYYIDMLSRQLSRIEQHNTLGWELQAFVDQFIHRWKTRRCLQKAQKAKVSNNRLVFIYDLHTLQLTNYRHAIKKLEELEHSDEYPVYTVDLIRKELQQRVARLESRWGQNGKARATVRRDQNALIAVEARALDLERKAVITAHEAGTISNETAKTLRDNVALMELDIEEQLE